MVTVATDKGSVGEGPERGSLVLSLLIGQEFRVVYASIVTLLVKLTSFNFMAVVTICSDFGAPSPTTKYSRP